MMYGAQEAPHPLTGSLSSSAGPGHSAGPFLQNATMVFRPSTNTLPLWLLPG